MAGFFCPSLSLSLSLSLFLLFCFSLCPSLLSLSNNLSILQWAQSLFLAEDDTVNKSILSKLHWTFNKSNIPPPGNCSEHKIIFWHNNNFYENRHSVNSNIFFQFLWISLSNNRIIKGIIFYSISTSLCMERDVYNFVLEIMRTLCIQGPEKQKVRYKLLLSLILGEVWWDTARKERGDMSWLNNKQTQGSVCGGSEGGKKDSKLRKQQAWPKLTGKGSKSEFHLLFFW